MPKGELASAAMPSNPVTEAEGNGHVIEVVGKTTGVGVGVGEGVITFTVTVLIVSSPLLMFL